MLGSRAAEAPVAVFLRVVQEAKPLIVQRLQESLMAKRHELARLNEWLLPHATDLLSVAGVAGLEDPYTELMAWAMNPPGHPDLALRCQKSWLLSLGVSEAKRMTKPATLFTQFRTDDGRPDLVMHLDEIGLLVIVEAKTISAEHETPGGQMQTLAYPRAVRQTLGLKDDYPTVVVFLTMDGSHAASEHAILDSYSGWVRALAQAVSPCEIADNDLRWAYSTLFTHLLAQASTDAFNALRAIRTASRLVSDGIAEDAVTDHLDVLVALIALLD